MTVVFVNRFCHPDHSATSQILSDLAAGLVSQGQHVTIVAGRQRYDDPTTSLAAHETWRGVEIHRIWATRFGRSRLWGRAVDYIAFYVSLPWTLLRVLRSGDVVVAKTDPPLVSLFVAPVAWLRGAVLVNWLQDLFPEVAVALGEPKLPRSVAWVLRAARNASLRFAAMNVAIGDRMAEHLVAEGIAPEKVRVIPNWGHEESIRPIACTCSRIRRSLGLEDRFVVGYSGNLGRAHDVDTLLEAVEKLSSHPEVAFLFVGGGHGYVRLKRQCLERNFSNAHFLPYQPLDRLSDSMAAANLHLVSLLPALEGAIVPSKFYGIAAAGRAMGYVGDPDGEIARLLARCKGGFSVRPGEGVALVQCILAMVRDRAECAAMGERNRRLLNEELSRQSAHDLWRTLLDGLALTNNHEQRSVEHP